MQKKKVLFIGSFVEKSKKGTVGGQMYACRALVESTLNNEIEWCLIDSTAESNLEQPLLIRIHKSLVRIIKFIYHVLFSKVDSVLIFTSSGYSFVEKGLMALISSYAGKKTVIFPRSGFIKNNLENSRFYKSYIIYVFSKVSHVGCQGLSWKLYFESYVFGNSNKFVVINNWIDTSKYLKANLIDREEGIISILFLAWVNKEKGIYELIEAARNLSKNYGNIKFTIAGNGKDFSKAKQKVREYAIEEYFIFRDWVLGDEKINLLQNSDIFVLPSYAEGFPNALLEAMSSGLPVIATNVGSIREAVYNGENGFLIEPKNVKELQNALEQLIINKTMRVEFGNNAFNTMIENYSFDSIYPKIKKLLC